MGHGMREAEATFGEEKGRAMKAVSRYLLLCTTKGTLKPPSLLCPFLPRRLPPLPSYHGPLSLENIISVFPSIPFALSVFTISPTLQSISSTVSPNFPARDFLSNFFDAHRGWWGKVWARYKKNGLLPHDSINCNLLNRAATIRSFYT